jgi:hypothetical protein
MEAVMVKIIFSNQFYVKGKKASFKLAAILLALTFLTTLIIQPALAGGGGLDFYVATTGIDSGNCLTNPCRTITYAMNQAGSGDRVHIAAGTYAENLTLNKNLNLIGAGMNATILDGGGIGVVIYDGSYNLAVMDMTIQNGHHVGGSGGGIAHWGGTLNLTRVKVVGNTANYGGGLFSSGELTITDCVFSGNNAETATNVGYGGGLFIQGNGVNTTLVNVSISGNTATGSSGGLHNQRIGTVNLTNVTISGNTAKTNGAITNTNSSILNLVNSTIADNLFSAGGSSGGIGNYATVNFKNTIVAGNAGSNCVLGGSGSALNTLGNNLDSANTCSFTHPSDYRNVNPLLGPLATNGGITYTRALLAGSPAIDSGTNSGCTSKDQRGMPRPKDGNLNGVATCDIGAYEFPDATFADVTSAYWAWNYIERLYNAGITSGCGSGLYCPENTVTRAEMAIFLLRGMHGSGYTPPSATGTIFTDVPTTHWAANWIEQLYAEGITGGCGGSNYCPEQPVNRAQMAIFLLRARHGSSYLPPIVGDSTGFADVPTTYWAAAWIKQLAAESITTGCGANNYCPEQSVTRAQMAIFLVRAFGLP